MKHRNVMTVNSIYCLLLLFVRSSELAETTDLMVLSQEITSQRPNTLSDDADDIQGQLDNEARDRLKYANPQSVWVFHLPTQLPVIYEDKKESQKRSLQTRQEQNEKNEDYDYFENMNKSFNVLSFLGACESWLYPDQEFWFKKYPSCVGPCQSPIDLPVKGLIKSKQQRKLKFINFCSTPKCMWVKNDGKRVMLVGEWEPKDMPTISGGAAGCRRYTFHSFTIHWPSEHSVEGLYFPVEGQALFVASNYKNFDGALKAASSDPLAFLAVSYIYMFSNHTHLGLEEMIEKSVNHSTGKQKLIPRPLNFYAPEFKEYAAYHGSLSFPPCTESVIWYIRGRSLPISRETHDMIMQLQCKMCCLQENRRLSQQLNERKVYYFYMM